MTTIIYADILFIINFCVDYICFYFVSKILNLKIKFVRIIFASIFGAIYGIVSVFFSNIFISIIFLILMMIVGFGYKGTQIFKIAFLYFMFSSTLGGLTTILYNYFENNFIIYFYILISTIISLIYYKSLSASFDNVTLNIVLVDNDQLYDETGFVDTGNLLVDPYNGNCVILVKKKVFGNNFNIYDKKGFRCIPINYLSEKFLNAFIPDKIIIKNKNKELEFEATIAVDETDGDYNGNLILIPKKLIGELL